MTVRLTPSAVQKNISVPVKDIYKQKPETQKKTEQKANPVAKPQTVKKAQIKNTVQKQASKETSSLGYQHSSSSFDYISNGSGTENASGSDYGSSGNGDTGGSGLSGVGQGGDALVGIESLQIVKKVTPDYPPFSRKRGEEGQVTIIITIENGVVTNAEIEKSSGFDRLDRSAVCAVKKWVFSYTGRIKARLPVNFKLK